MIKNTENLRQFLENLYQDCQNYLGVSHISQSSQSNQQSSNFIKSWREAWHPKRVSVYAQVVSKSQAIDLFHDPTFKTTPAIGGKNPGDDRPKYVSSVWHRMLPLDNDQYLEILTVFHGDCQLWQREGEDQLHSFIQRLKERGMQLTWGVNKKLNKLK